MNSAVIRGLVENVLMQNFDEPKPIPDFHMDLWNLVCDDHPYVAIAAPRGHAKTTAITHSYPIAAACFRAHDHILILSDTETQAMMFLGDIKNEFLENESLINLFEFDRFLKENEKELIGRFRDGHKFRMFVRGSEQKLRGMKWRNKRPNLIIGDDLENDEIVLNDERRKKFKKWLFEAVVPSLSDYGKLRLVGTILHFDSALENLMPEWNSEHTHTDGLKYWTTDPEIDWLSVRYDSHTDDFSRILWPEKFPEKRLKWLQAMFKRQGNPEGYAQEYRNYPIAVEDAYYRDEDFNPIPPGQKEEPLEYYVGVDLAISEKKHAAYSVFIIVGMNSVGMVRVSGVVRFRGDSLKICNTFFEIHDKYLLKSQNPPVFIVEQENITRAIGPFLEREMMTRNRFLVIEEVVPSKDKELRGRSWQARMRAGGVEFDTEATWYADLRTELLAFPKSKFKDQADALHHVGHHLGNMAQAMTAKEIEEQEYEDEMTDTYTMFGFQEEPSSITGYS